MLVPRRFRSRYSAFWDRLMRGASPLAIGGGGALHALRSDGSEFAIEVGLNPVEIGDEKMLLWSVADVSEHKQREGRLKTALMEKDILLGEIHHRVKNNLQVIHSLLDLQSAKIEDPAALQLVQESKNRISSMAMIHQTLYQSKDFARVDFGRFLKLLLPTLVSSYTTDRAEVSLKVCACDVSLPIDAAIPCGLIANELVSNALKHAFPNGRQGTISIDLTTAPTGEIEMTLADDGIGIPEDVELGKTSTLGLQLVPLLAEQLKADLAFQRSDPTSFTFRFGAVA